MQRHEPQGASLRGLIGPIYGGRKTCCARDILRRATHRGYARRTKWHWFGVGPSGAISNAGTVPIVKAWL
jgi:hypothetical protein